MLLYYPWVISSAESEGGLSIDKASLSCQLFFRRTAETFLKYSNRSLQYFRNPTESSFRGPEAKVKVILERLLTQENHVLEFWTSKKKRLDQTQQFCLFERSARQALAWIKEEGDIYLETHTMVSCIFHCKSNFINHTYIYHDVKKIGWHHER